VKLAVGARLELELVDPARNARRRYAMSVARDPQLRLDGEKPGLVLVVARGRLGGRVLVRREAFGELAALERRWRELALRRRRHGYVEVGSLALPA